MTMVIALPLPGAMGAGLGAVLTLHGARVLTRIDGRSAASVARAHAAGMEPADDAALARADVILSVVPPAIALETARRLAPLIAAGGYRPLYVDANSVSPATVRAIAAVIEGTGADFADGGIIGLPPGPDGSMPSLHVSGPGAVRAGELAALGLDVRQVAGGVGAASALKMCFAAINKGLIGLFAAVVQAAEREGAGEALHAMMTRTQAMLLARAERGLPDMVPKAYRWVAEMEEIADFLGHERPESAIWEGFAAFYAEIARDHAADGEAIALMERFLGRGMQGGAQD